MVGGEDRSERTNLQMNKQGVQIIEKDGEPEYAVVSIEAYHRMVAALEDAADSAASPRAAWLSRVGAIPSDSTE